MKRLLILSTLLLLFNINGWCQQQISGKVINANNDTPVKEANVEYGDDRGTSTNANGRFSIPCETDMQLIITHVSFNKWEGRIDNCDEPLTIRLTPTTRNLQSVQVTAGYGRKIPDFEQPRSVSSLSRAELNRNTGLFLKESLNLEPGIRMERRTMSGGQRIIIRGYGNSTNFNGKGYKAYLNGIPITTASGTTILDDIDFSNLGSVEVIKGPSSSLYGSGIAGVVNMYTQSPTPQQTSISQGFVGGSYGLLGTNTRFETATEESSILLNYGLQNYDSYRVHSASEEDHLSFVGNFRPSDKRTVSTYLSYNNSYNQLAGQLDSTQFYNRENVGSQRYLDNDGRVRIESFRAGVSHRYQFSSNFSNRTSGFISTNRLKQAYAVGFNDNGERNFGARTEFRYSTNLNSNISIKGVTGGEFQKTTGLYKTYGLSGGQLGGLNSDNDIASTQYNVFTQWDLLLPSDIKITVGASLNQVSYEITDRLANSSNPNRQDLSGDKTFEAVFTPRISLQKQFNDKVSVYGSISSGYSPPTTDQVVIPYTGEVNTGLSPEAGTQYEIGTKGRLLNNRLSWELALFRLHVSDKLTSRTVTDNSGSVLYSYAVNAGNQNNDGIELSLSYAAVNNPDKNISYVRPFATFSYSHFTYSSFKSGSQDYSGNRVIGVPPVTLNAGIDMKTRWGIYMKGTYRYVDEMDITFDNNHKAPSYGLLNGKIGFEKELGEHFNLDLYTGGKNLTDELYYNMVFLNWQRGPQPSIYSPGAYTPTFYGGFNLKYTF